MAVASISPNAYELTADEDRIDEVLKVTGFQFVAGAAGAASVLTNIITVAQDGTITQRDLADGDEIWNSGSLSDAGEVAESGGEQFGYCRGIALSAAAGGRLVVYVA